MFYPEQIEELRQRGYVAITHERIREGQRVRHNGEQYAEAINDGTATVYAVMENAGSTWAHSYNKRDIEVVVKRDRDPADVVSCWADYHTATTDKEVTS